ncbi:sensor histidine kinase [Flavobacterium algicola]|uniref:sensor histidine kinase n=1 Tax=Flavobacterium algicola TaxID=556529 RepID=UPI001EFED8A0|nr:histidine kinase [Flavobacterium algicola]MCG9791487.1 histidine kinase [Flavobacterium algicola]
MKLEQIKNTISNQILIHSIIWCLFILVALIPLFENKSAINSDFCFQWASGIALFYFNFYYLVPQLLLQKKLWEYLMILSAIITVFVVIRITLLPHEMRVEDMRNINGRIVELIPKRRPPLLMKFLPILFYLFITAGSTVIKTLSEYYTNQQNKLIEEAKRTASELNYLRKQTNPHFLFNALNSIYSLAYQKSDKVPDAIVTLSEMMRYMLYETDNQTVFLEKEINYIKNYIELQKLRLNNIENIYINVHGNTKDIHIEPLLLIGFVENAFKYGTDYKGVAYVKIVINIEDNILDFCIENKVQDFHKDPENSGIGMSNIESRLNLLYPKTHQLTTLEKDDNFRVQLKLTLDQLKKKNT